MPVFLLMWILFCGYLSAEEKTFIFFVKIKTVPRQHLLDFRKNIINADIPSDADRPFPGILGHKRQHLSGAANRLTRKDIPLIRPLGSCRQ